MNWANARTDVLKEPRGFIKVIQFLFSILAFACCVDWRGHLNFDIKCSKNETAKPPIPEKEIKVKKTFSYPFALDEVTLMPEERCPNFVKDPFDFEVNAANDAQFFVFIGVVAFIASILICVGYVLYEDVYLSTPRYAWGDLILHGALAFLWFVSSCAYAASIWKIKKFTSYAWVAEELPDCLKGKLCEVKTTPGYANLDIAALCGFVNVFLWAANIWFLYKETRQPAGGAGEGFPSDMQDSPTGGGGGYEPYGPGPAMGGSVGGADQWGPGRSAVQSGMDGM